MPIKLQLATPDQAPAIAAFRQEVAQELTKNFGAGPWSIAGTDKGVLFDIRNGPLFVALRRNQPIASLKLCTKKPWAIDVKYFTKCVRPLYLLSMAVHPSLQRQGIGRLCVAEAIKLARQWPADAIRLDAYDLPAGAGEFYRKCGFSETGRIVYRTVPLIYYELIL